MQNRPMARAARLIVVPVLASFASAQDSVSLIPGNSDALNVYEEPAIKRYVVDSVPLASSWNQSWRLTPIMKAFGDDDPLFSTQALSASATSPDHLTNLTFASTPYSVWTTAGAGISTPENSAPGTVNATAFVRRFGVGISDFASVATNVSGALVGQVESEPNRFYVTRILAAASRLSPDDPNTSTVTLGSLDATGNLFLRADNFGCSGQQVAGENIVRINLPGRSVNLNTLFFDGATNRGNQIAATSFILNAATTTTNTPACIPNSGSGAVGVVLDFANAYKSNGGAPVSTHLAPGIAAHRGNPSFSSINPLGGVGTVASLARTNGGTRTDSINLFALDAAGSVAATRSATMPVGITDGQGFTANSAPAAEFKQYLSQTTFRGGNGQVGLGVDPITATYVAAATATDPTAGEFIAVARFGASVTWTVAAYEGKAVLDGPAGNTIGTIADASPVSISAPGADLSGNIYFVASMQPTVGPPVTALIRAVNTPSGYRLERLLQSGQTFAGANSMRNYTINRLTLGDSDSIASGSFFSGNVLQPIYPGVTPTGPADPRSVGGVVVNVQLTYDNAGTPEPYQVALLVTPDIAPPPVNCLGDANGDNVVNFADVTGVLANFGNDYTPGTGPGDANFNGVVNFADVTTVLANFGNTCP